MGIQTFPTQEEMEQIQARTPDYMMPNDIPLAVHAEGYLTDDQCDAMIEDGMRLEPYEFHGCNAVTREFNSETGTSSLAPMRFFADLCNETFWQFELAIRPKSWLQTYEKGGQYKPHVDTAPGQSRKLTAVALLTDENDYEGGNLTLGLYPAVCHVPLTRGTIVVFPSYLVHSVSPLLAGKRQTINMGFYGPPFK